MEKELLKTRIKKIIKKNKIIIFIVLFVIIILCFYNNTMVLNKIDKYVEKTSIINYLYQVNDKKNIQNIRKNENKKINNYIGILEIPKINLFKGLVAKNDIYNDVDYNIQILNQSTMPNNNNSYLFLAAHSGNSKVSYFKDLYKLTYDDEIYFYYNEIKYIYKVSIIYEINKTGYAHIKNDNDKKQLILITCIEGSEKQLIIICDLIEERDEYDI